MEDHVEDTFIRLGLVSERLEAHFALRIEELEPNAGNEVQPSRSVDDQSIGPNLSLDPISFGGNDMVTGEETDHVVGPEMTVGLESSGSVNTCPYPPGFGPCAEGHVHRTMGTVEEGLIGDRMKPMVSASISNGGESDCEENVHSTFLSPVSEARTVIRVCEDSGLCFRRSEKKLIEVKLSEVDDRIGAKSYNLRSKRGKAQAVMSGVGEVGK
ncbi:hypothetical protein PIB30_042726 [Stylosanthes scabra]|uniref:Uncharacterized protein n=1 Tax=Stylosanthes scabra TaxID=79078 RepID=A0ABU6QFL5_9FABA|nr:hypothetical protein [Stylosanthes scabra]